MSVHSLLRLEGTFVFLGTIWGYLQLDAVWWLFPALFFTPDLFMVGYLAGPRFGAAIYNAGHTYVAPILLGVGAVVEGSSLGGAMALIWAGHIGMDRAFGYGLKRSSGFQDTHLNAAPNRMPPERTDEEAKKGLSETPVPGNGS